MIMIGSIKNGGEVRRKSDGKIFTDVHVSSTGRISATEKVSAEVSALKQVPEVLNFADPDEFEPWDPENTNPLLPVVRPVGVGEVVNWAGLFAVVQAVEGSRVRLDAGVSAPVDALKRVDAVEAIAAQRERISALLGQVRELTEKIEAQEEAVAMQTAKILKLTDDLRMRDARIDVLENRNQQMDKRVSDLEKVNGLQQEKIIDMTNMGMRVYTLVYDPLSEQSKADEFMNLHLAHGAKHWTDNALGNGKFIIRIASRKPAEKIVELPTEKAEEAGKDEVAV